MLDFDEYIVDLLTALVHLRIFEFVFEFDETCPIVDVHQFIRAVSDQVPHLEYISIPSLHQRHKRIGGELVICNSTECPRFEF
jgi:hypothetical protein